jgi:hypothetical protein
MWFMLCVIMQLPNRTHNISGKRELESERQAVLSTYINTRSVTGLILLILASFLITLPEMQESAKSLLLVAFTCAAMLQGN